MSCCHCDFVSQSSAIFDLLVCHGQSKAIQEIHRALSFRKNPLYITAVHGIVLPLSSQILEMIASISRGYGGKMCWSKGQRPNQTGWDMPDYRSLLRIAIVKNRSLDLITHNFPVARHRALTLRIGTGHVAKSNPRRCELKVCIES